MKNLFLALSLTSAFILYSCNQTTTTETNSSDQTNIQPIKEL